MKRRGCFDSSLSESGCIEIRLGVRPVEVVAVQPKIDVLVLEQGRIKVDVALPSGCFICLPDLSVPVGVNLVFALDGGHPL